MIEDWRQRRHHRSGDECIRIKRCHYVATAGAEHPLIPDPKSAEGRRARVEPEHPAPSRSISFLSVVMLLIGVRLNGVQIAEPISQIPAIAENLGRFESPIHLPIWLNFALAIGALLASTERHFACVTPCWTKPGNDHTTR